MIAQSPSGQAGTRAPGVVVATLRGAGRAASATPGLASDFQFVRGSFR
ncbi:hypothetical protein [Achromobacter sp.]|nr:hypothetical protein [Achromobacter sp.]